MKFTLLTMALFFADTKAHSAAPYEVNPYRRLVQIETTSQLKSGNIITSIGSIISKTSSGITRYYVIATSHGLANVLNASDIKIQLPYSDRTKPVIKAKNWIADPLSDIALIEIDCTDRCLTFVLASFDAGEVNLKLQWKLSPEAQSELFTKNSKYWIAGNHPLAVVPFSTWNTILTSQLNWNNNSSPYDAMLEYSFLTQEYISKSGITLGMSGSPLIIKNSTSSSVPWAMAGIVTKRLRYFEETYFASMELATPLLNKYESDKKITGNLGGISWVEAPDFFYRKSADFSEIDLDFLKSAGSFVKAGGGGTADGGGGGSADGGGSRFADAGKSVFSDIYPSNSFDSVNYRELGIGNFLKYLVFSDTKWSEFPQHFIQYVNLKKKNIIGFRAYTKFKTLYLQPTIDLYRVFLTSPSLLVPLYQDEISVIQILKARVNISKKQWSLTSKPEKLRGYPFTVELKSGLNEQSIEIHLFDQRNNKAIGFANIELSSLKPLVIIEGIQGNPKSYIADISGVFFHNFNGSFTKQLFKEISIDEVLFNLGNQSPSIRIREWGSTQDTVIPLN